MKKFSGGILTLAVLLLSFLFPIYVQAAPSQPTRVINVVYDDSGSMIENLKTHEECDTWCKAKYSMEVFAAMLGDLDTMNVYVMSDFGKNETDSGPRLTLDGSDGAQENVTKIHEMVTYAGNTPFETVKKAYTDLTQETADEKWLVILTDGTFQRGGDINSYFAAKDPGIKIMFLGMGSDGIDQVNADPSKGIFFERAESNSEILGKVTEICSYIYSNDKLNVDTATQSFSFDVPMSELVVFAQGPDVEVGNLVAEDGTVYSSISAPVTVKYSTKATTNPQYSNHIYDENLVGSIATFRGDIPAGNYTVQAQGAETIEVYYKPNVDIKVYLVGEDGREYTEGAVETGEYTVNIGFVKSGTDEKVPASALLGEIAYRFTLTEDGVQQEYTYTNGDKIFAHPGKLRIDAAVDYLKYNQAIGDAEFNSVQKSDLTFTFLDTPVYQIDREGLMNPEEPTLIKVQVDGRDLTAAEWNRMELPRITIPEKLPFEIGEPELKKSSQIGVFELYLSLVTAEEAANEKISEEKAKKPTAAVEYKNFDVHVEGELATDLLSAQGEGDGTIKMVDNRSWFELHYDEILKAIAIGIAGFILFGYLPIFKKYLPKDLKRRPVIKGSPTKPGMRDVESHGSYSKSTLSTLIPYKAETGTIKFMPRGVPGGGTAMKVKAAGSRRMKIVNFKSYAGKENITFNGQPIPSAASKPPVYTSGVIIKVTTPGMDYTCVPKR